MLLGCKKEEAFEQMESVDRIMFYDAKLQTSKEIKEEKKIEEILNYLKAKPDGWRSALITLPINYFTVVFYEGNIELRTLYVGADYMSDKSVIRSMTPQEVKDFYDLF